MSTEALTPMAELAGRWGVTANTVSRRLAFLGIKPIRQGNYRFLDPEQLEQAEALHQHILSGKPQEDVTYFWGNMGSCVDIFAPGVQIYSACGGAKRCSKLGDSSYTMATGSSMAAPMVAGAAALYLEQNPSATPAEVKKAVLGQSTDGAIREDYFPPELWLPGTPNTILRV